MKKMTVAEAAEFFGVSKEAIHNRVRRGSLRVELVDGEKYVYIEENTSAKPPRKVQKTPQPSDERYYNLLLEQNLQLQQKVQQLEDETRTLRDQKEQMLIEERKKIEQIYKDKDEQLKNILNVISSKFLPNNSSDAEIIEVEEPKRSLISLKKYLKEQNYSKKKQKKLIATFEKNKKSDKRIFSIKKKIYIDLQRYNYSDYLL